VPQVKLLRSLGKADADRLEINHLSAREGAIVTVEGEAYSELLKRGLAADIPAVTAEQPQEETPTRRRGNGS
jgi:hypothetical protein